MLDEKSFISITESLNKEVKLEIGSRLDNIRAITASIGPDGMYYITAWYKAKGYDLSEAKGHDNYAETFDFNQNWTKNNLRGYRNKI